MILYPPVRFDANEWFIIVATFVNWTLMFLLPRRFSFVTVVSIWTFNYCLAHTADFTLAVKPYDLYDFGDRPELEYFDWVLYFFTYPPAAYFVLYLYDRWKPKGWKLAVYIVCCAELTNALEWVSTLWFHVFTYRGWNPLLSGPVYILVYGLNVLLLNFIRRYVPETASAGAASNK